MGFFFNSSKNCNRFLSVKLQEKNDNFKKWVCRKKFHTGDFLKRPYCCLSVKLTWNLPKALGVGGNEKQTKKRIFQDTIVIIRNSGLVSQTKIICSCLLKRPKRYWSKSNESLYFYVRMHRLPWWKRSNYSFMHFLVQLNISQVRNNFGPII